MDSVKVLESLICSDRIYNLEKRKMEVEGGIRLTMANAVKCLPLQWILWKYTRYLRPNPDPNSSPSMCYKMRISHIAPRKWLYKYRATFFLLTIMVLLTLTAWTQQRFDLDLRSLQNTNRKSNTTIGMLLRSKSSWNHLHGSTDFSTAKQLQPAFESLSWIHLAHLP